MVNIYYNKNTDRQIDSSGGNSFSAPQLCYQDLPTWRIFFKNIDSAAGTITAVDVSDAVVWKAAVDDDFDHASEVMCRTLDANIDSSQSSLGIIDVLLDANTAPFETAIGTADKKSPVYFQLEGFNTAGKRIHNALIKITATNTVDPLGGDPPNPVGNYYTKTEINALLRAGYELQFSVDGETLWHDIQADEDRFWQYRYPDSESGSSGEWSPALEMVVGPQGDTGWSPVLAVITDGTRRVYQVADWVGGEGTKPAVGGYVGVAGIVELIADAVDIRGSAGNNAPATQIQFSINGTTLWHTPFVSGDLFIRYSVDGGATWGNGYRFIGQDGTAAPAVQIEYSPDDSTWHAYTAGDIYIRFSTDNGATWSSGMLFTSSGVSTDIDFTDADISSSGILELDGLRRVAAILDDTGKVIDPDDIVYNDDSIPTTDIDLSSYLPISNTWKVVFVQGKDGTSAPQDNWQIIPITNIITTPTSTSVLSMVSLLNINEGDAIKYVDSRGTFYAIITAVDDSTPSITIAGAPFDTGQEITALYVGNNKVIQLDFFISDTYGDDIGDLLLADMNTYFRWHGRKAYLVGFSAIHTKADGTANPKINVKIAGSLVSTNDTNLGIQLSTADTWVDNSAVEINTSNYDINRGESVEINCSAAGTDGDTENLTVSCIFIQE